MRQRLKSLDYGPSALGVAMITAAYSPQGAAWADAQIAHLQTNREIFDAGINAIPGVKSMPLQSTYLAWVDFADTGMPHEDVAKRIRETAKIAVSQGPTFGTGGETFMRFNLATQRATVEEAVKRMQNAFADLQ
jgi:cystathionine beta-lyase